MSPDRENRGRSETLGKARQLLAVAVLSLSMLLNGCKPDTRSSTINSTLPTQPAATEVFQTSPTPQNLSTEWRVCGKVDEEGEGPISVLRQAANGEEPHEWSKTIQQQIVIITPNEQDPNKPNVRVYSWRQLLEQNPIVEIGDIVCDTTMPPDRLLEEIQQESQP